MVNFWNAVVSGLPLLHNFIHKSLNSGFTQVQVLLVACRFETKFIIIFIIITICRLYGSNLQYFKLDHMLFEQPTSSSNVSLKKYLLMFWPILAQCFLGIRPYAFTICMYNYLDIIKNSFEAQIYTKFCNVSNFHKTLNYLINTLRYN